MFSLRGQGLNFAAMMHIDNVLLSDEIVEEQFVCDLIKCKGGCCVDGDAGAPLEKNELQELNEACPSVLPYLSNESVAELQKQGNYVYDKEFGWVTPTLGNDKEICVYGIRGSDGIIKCAFEQAYYDGNTYRICAFCEQGD